MKCYADSSFILQLLVEDFANEEAVHCFRRLGRPALLFSGLHTLEITNGLRLRLFAAAAMGSKARALARRQNASAHRRLLHLSSRGTLRRVSLSFEDAITEATALTEIHTEHIGTRSLDTLHVASALLLKADKFLTCDERQSMLAKRAGLPVELIG